MPQSAQVPGGIVSSLQGRANVIVAGEKQARPLQQGDVIQPGDVILAEQDTQLQITDTDGQAWMPRDTQLALADTQGRGAHAGKNHGADKAAAQKATLNLDDAINAVERGDEDAATAAGLAGGGGGAMSLGLRVDRVIETVSPQEFAYSTPDRDAGTPIATATNAVVDVGNRAPYVNDPENNNYKPAAGRYQVQTEEDKAVSGQVKATDPDGDALTYAKGSDPLHGTIAVKPDGTWTYTPDKDYHGGDSFTVTVSDGKGGTTTAIVDIGITPVNDQPEIDDPDDPNYDPSTGHYKLSTPEDTPVSGHVTARDPDGDALNYSMGRAPEHGSVVVNADGTWTYTPAKDYNGFDTFTVLVSDGQGGSTTATIDIGVIPVNDAPKIDDPGNLDPTTGHYKLSTDEDTPVKGQVKATDPDGDTLTYTQDKGPAHGSVSVNPDGTWTYTPNKDFNGDDSFTVLVSDGHGGTTTATIDIGVKPLNDAPKIDDPDSPNYDPVTGRYVAFADEDTPVKGQVKATDPDGDALTYTQDKGPAHGSVSVNPDGTWTYIPDKNFNGNDTFTVLVSDGKGGTTTATIDIGVKPINDAPKIDDPGNPNIDPATGHYKLSTDEDTPVKGQVKATDPDGDTLTYAKGEGPTHGTVTVNENGTWTYTPNKDFNGDDSFTVLVSDDHGGTTTATIDIGVKPVNDAPVISSQGNPAVVSEEGLAGANADDQGKPDTGNTREATGQFTVSDAEGDKLSLTLSGPGGLTSGGVAITWSGSGTLTDPLIGKAGNTPILSATIDAQGHYKVTLQGPVDHANPNVEDVRSIALQVNVNDGHQTSSTPLTVLVEDDSPLSGTQVMQVSSTTGSQNTNLMLIIDTSGSMKDALADMTVNGIKSAIKTLIDRYDDLGDVKIQIVTFSDAGQGRATWLTVSQAKTFVDALTSNSGTDYDAALAAAKAAFTAPGKLADGVNVSYFITDGQPNRGKEIDSGADETNWETFLKANHIDSYAIGTGGLTAQHIANIEPIAYNGITGTEQAATTLKTNAELSKYLLDTVPTLKSGSLAELAGADGLKQIESFTSTRQISSVLDANTKILTVTLQSGAEIKLNTVTGAFTLKQGHDGGNETFSYTMVDKDGDRASGTITLASGATVTSNHAPVVSADNDGHNILGLVDLAVNPLLDLSKSQHVAVSDVDNNLVRVDVSVGQFLSLGTLLGDHSKLTLALDPALTQGLHISGNDSRHLVIESEIPGNTIDAALVNKLLATLSYDPAHVLGLSVDLFPQLTIKATDAAGASDSKSISSSIVAIDVEAPALPDHHEHTEPGHGDHHGSCDTDVFAWTLADRPSQGEHQIDTISDFNCAARSAGGDVLDLRDLLQTDHHASTNGGTSTTGSVDKLLNFLDFDTQSQPGSTIIHVSASGGFHADATGHSDSSGCSDQQQIVLTNVDIRASLGLDQSANDHQIISELMNRGKLLVDNC